MKANLFGSMIVGLVVLMASTSITVAQSAVGSSRLGVFGRYHTAHSVFTDLPYDDDFSYGVTYQYHESAAYWEVAVGYSADVGGSLSTTDHIVTPEINLIFKDSVWRGGVGILKSYIEDNDGESDWSDLYWQFKLGLGFPIGRFNLDVLAIYVFEDWDELGDFDGDDIEGSAALTYPF